MRRSRISSIVICFILAACSDHRMMYVATYEQITIGETIKELQIRVGAPYEIRKLPSGSREFIYIERTKLTAQRDLYREYTILIGPDGRVQKKSYKEISSPAFQIQM